VTDQLFLSADLKQAKTKHSSIKLQPIQQKGSHADVGWLQNAELTKQQEAEMVGRPDHGARVEIFKRKISEQLQKVKAISPRTPATLPGMQTHTMRTEEQSLPIYND
jgi:hypothetical protein